MDSPGRQQGETVLLEQMEGRKEREVQGVLLCSWILISTRGNFFLGFSLFVFPWHTPSTTLL